MLSAARLAVRLLHQAAFSALLVELLLLLVLLVQSRCRLLVVVVAAERGHRGEVLEGSRARTWGGCCLWRPFLECWTWRSSGS